MSGLPTAFPHLWRGAGSGAEGNSLSSARRQNLWKVPLKQLEISDLSHFRDIRFDDKDRPLRRSFKIPFDELEDLETALEKTYEVSGKLASTAFDVSMTTGVAQAIEAGENSGVDRAERDIGIMRELQRTLARSGEVVKQWEEVQTAMEGMLEGRARLKTLVLDMEERQKKREAAAVVDAEAAQMTDEGGAVLSALEPVTVSGSCCVCMLIVTQEPDTGSISS